MRELTKLRIRLLHKTWLKTLAFFFVYVSRGVAIKVGVSSSKKNCFICFNESPLKKMENTFYFILKALFFLKIFKFLSWLLLIMQKKLLD